MPVINKIVNNKLIFLFFISLNNLVGIVNLSSFWILTKSVFKNPKNYLQQFICFEILEKKMILRTRGQLLSPIFDSRSITRKL